MTYYKAKIAYDRPKDTCGRRFYTRLRITWTGTLPPHTRRSSYFLGGKVPITCG
jgi:hypothetical protein